MRPPSRQPSLPSLLSLLLLSLSGCVVAASGPHPLPPPPAPLTQNEAVERAFAFAEHNGYGRLSLRQTRLEGDVWQVLLRVKDPFKGRVLVSVDAYDGHVLNVDAWQKERQHGRDDGEDEERGRQGDREEEHGNGHGKGHGKGHGHAHDRDDEGQRGDEED